MKQREAPQCPRCNRKDDVKKIAYGLIAPDPTAKLERDGYALGGCCIRPDNPEWYCDACEESFGASREHWGKPLSDRVQ